MARQPATALPLWQRAAASVQSKPATVVFVGSSTTQGSVASTASRRYIEVLGSMLRRRLGATTDTHTHISTSAEDTAIVKTGTITRTYAGLSHQNYSLSAGATLTFPFSGQALTVLYTQGLGAGDFTVSIDGGTTITITPSTTGAIAHTGSSTLTGLTASAHTAIITAIGSFRFCGAVAHSNQLDRGLYIYNSGIGGATAQAFATDTGHAQRIGTLAPHLIVIMLGSNDFANNVPLATYMTNVKKVISDIRATSGGLQADILLVHSYLRFDVTSPLHAWAAYGAALKSVALSTNCAFVDISSYYPTSQATDIIRPGGGHISEGLISNDGIHQTDYGYAYMAQLLLDTML